MEGLELESVLEAIGRWGAGSPLLPDSESVSVDTFVLGLRNRFRPDRAADVQPTYELRFGDEAFELIVDEGELSVRRGCGRESDHGIRGQARGDGGGRTGRRPVKSAFRWVEGDKAGQPTAFAALFGSLPAPVTI